MYHVGLLISDECVYGDYRGLFDVGAGRKLSCSQIGSEALHKCYETDIEADCCETCSRPRPDHPGNTALTVMVQQLLPWWQLGNRWLIIIIINIGLYNKRSNNSYERPHRRGIFYRENLMWHSCASAQYKKIGAVAYVHAVKRLRAVAF